MNMGMPSRVIAGFPSVGLWWLAHDAQQEKDYRAAAVMASLAAACLVAALTGKDPYNPSGKPTLFARLRRQISRKQSEAQLNESCS